MRHLQIILAVFVLALITFTGCKDDEIGNGTLIISFKGKESGNNFAYNTTYQTALEYKYQITLINYYLSNIKLVNNDGSEKYLIETAFIDFTPTHTNMQEPGKEISVEVPEGDYKGLKFDLGVDSTLNHTDAATYDADHPLSIYNGNFWTWNSGYIFFKLEGKIDSVANGNEDFSTAFAYHCGTDPLYREIPVLNKSFSIIEDQSYTFNVDVNVETFFSKEGNYIDVQSNPISHTSGSFDLAEDVTNNFASSFSVGN